MANDNDNLIGCVGRACEWLGTSFGEMWCVTGSGGCGVGNLLEAEESKFHDSRLIEATRQINQILRSIQPDDERHVAIIDTKRGYMLAWVFDRHDYVPSGDETSIRSDDTAIAMTLGLKGLVVDRDDNGVPLIIGATDSFGTTAS